MAGTGGVGGGAKRRNTQQEGETMQQKQLLRDLGNTKRKLCIVKERKSSVKEAGTEGSDGTDEETQERFRGGRDADRLKDCVRVRRIKTTCVRRR